MTDAHSASYDLVVIGSGPAGSSGALAASYFGKKVALIERAKNVGGAGINTGTIPSKALRESALMLSGSRARKMLGLNVTLERENLLKNLSYLSQHVQHALRVQTEYRLHHRDATLLHGQASLVDANTVRIVDADGSEKFIRGSHLLIATGSSPLHPPARGRRSLPAPTARTAVTARRTTSWWKQSYRRRPPQQQQ